MFSGARKLAATVWEVKERAAGQMVALNGDEWAGFSCANDASRSKEEESPAKMTSAVESPSRFVAASDGLRLHYLDFPGGAALAPVVCLPGLARAADDFDPLARALQADGRRVLALDYRGRGRSAWDADWRHYDFDVEQDDIFTVLDDAGVARALFVGTSRGGLHMMRISATRPDVILAGVLNDVGPEIDHAGLLRIKRYVGKLPPLASMRDAIALMRLTAGAHFAGVSPEEWETYARNTFVEANGKVSLRYDPELSHTLDSVTPDKKPDSYWAEFGVLTRQPVLAIRGENSDILSERVFDEMARLAPKMERYTVGGQGHAPLLLDEQTIARIGAFLRQQV